MTEATEEIGNMTEDTIVTVEKIAVVVDTTTEVMTDEIVVIATMLHVIEVTKEVI